MPGAAFALAINLAFLSGQLHNLHMYGRNYLRNDLACLHAPFRCFMVWSSPRAWCCNVQTPFGLDLGAYGCACGVVQKIAWERQHGIKKMAWSREFLFYRAQSYL